MESHQIKKTDILWPPTLNLPARPPKLIYLDLNHWIALSKAHSGHQDGDKHRTTLDACVNAVVEGKAVFPLSEYIYTEISKIKNYRQRNDLREVIEEVGRYMVVTSLATVVTHEIEAVLDQMVGPNPAPLNAMNYLDWGVNRAFGRVGDIRIESSSGEDVTDEVRINNLHGPEGFDEILKAVQLELNRKVIDGPTSQEEPGLREDGWSPETIVQMYEQKASEELAQVRRFDDYPKWRRGRTRDVVIARELNLEVSDIFAKGFERRGVSAQDRFSAATCDDLRSIYSAMPSSSVTVALKTSLHRDANHRWTNNDIFDMRALSLTIPYCDVVVTDRSMSSHVTRNKLPERYGTVVISQLSGLPDHLGPR